MCLHTICIGLHSLFQMIKTSTTLTKIPKPNEPIQKKRTPVDNGLSQVPDDVEMPEARFHAAAPSDGCYGLGLKG